MSATPLNPVPADVHPFRAGGNPGMSAHEIMTRGLMDAATASVLLADVSEFQPNVVDAAYLKWSKAIVIRALYGDAHDDAAWYGGQRRALLHSGGAQFVGIYQYLVAGQSGKVQAQAFKALVGDLQPGEVFIADFEEGANKTVLTDWYNEMLALYGAAIHPYLWAYTGLYFGEATGALPVEWIADYTNAEPTTPHKLWQFTDSYNVPGVGVADCSLFHGTIAQLAALAHATPTHPPVATYNAPVGIHLINAGHTSVNIAWGDN
ncbi:MAG: GH25 family lysozyme, partial [Nitrososphaerales archaeon]